jgi:hypothetical protein
MSTERRRVSNVLWVVAILIAAFGGMKLYWHLAERFARSDVAQFGTWQGGEVVLVREPLDGRDVFSLEWRGPRQIVSITQYESVRPVARLAKDGRLAMIVSVDGGWNLMVFDAPNGPSRMLYYDDRSAVEQALRDYVAGTFVSPEPWGFAGEMQVKRPEHSGRSAAQKGGGR